MALYKNVTNQKCLVFAWDTVNDTEKTGNAASITARISKDGAAMAASSDTNPTELDATYAPGVYAFDLSQAETNCDLFCLFAKSATSGIKLEPVIAYTFDITDVTDDVITALDSLTADIWTYATRTLTTSSGSAGSSISGSSIVIFRGDTLTLAITGIGNISARTNLWFTVKSSYDSADTAALIQIDTTTGLKYINAGVAGTAANGSITVDNATDGDITIVLDEVETAKLSAASGLYYDVQMKTATTIQTMTIGSATVTPDVTKATS